MTISRFSRATEPAPAGRRTHAFLALLLSMLAISGAAHAQSTWDGSVSSDWFDAGNWSNGAPSSNLDDAIIDGAGTAPVISGNAATVRGLTLGSAGATTGSLTINNDGTLQSDASTIGQAASSDYSVTVSGATSSWQSIGQFWGIFIGDQGAGTLNIVNGADVVSNTSHVGTQAGEGHVLVEGAGSTWTLTQSSTDALLVGNAGHGELIISNGGVITSSVASIGYASTGTGEAIVTGAGSEWNTTFGLDVAYRGDGQLSILNGGAVNTGTSAFIGTNSGANGTALVSGAGATWTVDGTLYVANFGDAADQTTGALTIADGGTVTVGGGAGAVSVAVVDDYTDGTINIGGASGDPAAAPGTLNAALVDLHADGALVFNHTSTAYTFDSDIQSTLGAAITHLAGTTIYTGDGSLFLGDAQLLGGTLLVNGTLGFAGAGTIVVNGGTLGGTGTLPGDVVYLTGTIAPGNSPGTLTIGGDLTLSGASILDFELGNPAGTPGVDSDLINVGGDLTLDGTLNVIDAGGFGMGTYRLINYGGILTDNGLDVGTVPASFVAGDMTVQTATAGQVNLLVGAASNVAFWDGPNTSANNVVDGGSGTWLATTTNWTDAAGSANAVYDPTSFLVFSGADGSVFVDNSAGAVTVANGMQFAVSGYTVIGGDLTLSGATTIRVGDGTTGSSGDIAVIGSSLVGSGSLQKSDFGILTLSATNSYTGGTTVTAGTLAGAAGSLQGDIVNNATLAFMQQTADGTYADVLSGTGTTNKTGSFALTLTGNSSGYDGTTNIVAGTLFVDGELGGVTTVSNGATLGGSGSMESATVGSGGTLAPGNSISTLDVQNATFNAGSIFEVELNDGGNAPAVNSDLLATSNAVINGGTVHVTPENGTDDGTSYTPGLTYTIITTGSGVPGTFTGLTDDYAFLTFALSYDANNVYLTSALGTDDWCLSGMSDNECAAAEGIESVGSGSLYTAVMNLSDAAAAEALNELSGEIHASARTALLEDSRFARDAVLGRARTAFDGLESGDGQLVMASLADMPEDASADPNRLALWVSAFGSWAEWDGDGNAAELDRSIGGVLVGGDALIAEGVRLGLFTGYSHTSLDLDARRSSASIDSYHLGAYGAGEWGNLGLRGGAGYSWHDIETDRSADFTGFSDDLSADYDAGTVQVFAEVGYRLDMGTRASFEPFANVAYVNLDTDGFTENGGEAALTAGGEDTDATFTTLGLRAEMGVALGGATGSVHGMVGWRHAFDDLTPAAQLSFESGGDDFTVSGVPIAEDTFVLDAGIDLDLTPDATLGLSYGGEFGSGISDQSVKANFALTF